MSIIQFLYIINEYMIYPYLLCMDNLHKYVLKLKTKMVGHNFLQYALYNKETKQFIWIYNYDSFLSLCFLLLKYMCKVPVLLIPIDSEPVTQHSYVIVTSYINNGVIQYQFTDVSSQNMPINTDHTSKFVYCVIDDDYDVTHAFDLFHDSISKSSALTCQDIINIIFMFLYHKRYSITSHSVVKVMLDDKFVELTFKGNERLILYNGTN